MVLGAEIWCFTARQRDNSTNFFGAPMCRRDRRSIHDRRRRRRLLRMVRPGAASARTEFRDCFSYACAKAHGAKLLFKGEDFAQDGRQRGRGSKVQPRARPRMTTLSDPNPSAPSSIRPRTSGPSGSRLRAVDHARAARRRETRRRSFRGRRMAATRTASGPTCSTAPIRTQPPSRPASPRKAQSTDPLFFAILDNATGAALGYPDLSAHRSAEPRHRGR